MYGMQAVIDDTAALYAQDDTPNNETQYRARFYLNPNSLTMATNDVLDLFTGRNGTNDVLRIQLQKNGVTYQIRAGLLNDAGTWTDTSWYDVPNAWSSTIAPIAAKRFMTTKPCRKSSPIRLPIVKQER
jgi:hypothetical protein